MGFMTYFMGLVVSGLVALLLRALLLRLTRNWSAEATPGRYSLLLPILRAFPVAFAFAPTMLMKKGLGVLIPASLFLFPTLGALPFQGRQLDADDKHNLSVAATSCLAVWAVSAFILLVRQLGAAEKQAANERKD